jgi:hypothetical protein
MDAPAILLPQADIRGFVFYGKRVLRFPKHDSHPLTRMDPGSIAWVREDFADLGDGRYLHAATDKTAPPPGIVWRPASEMPVAASRLTLVVRRVSENRLFDLDHISLREEGIFHDGGEDFLSKGEGWGHPGSDDRYDTARGAYENYWATTRSPCDAASMVDLVEVDVIHSDMARLAAAFARAA